MPKTSEYINDDESDQEYTPSKKQAEEDVEEFEEEVAPANKKRKRATEETSSSSSSFERDDEGNPYFTLSSKRRVMIRKFPSGDAAVDIREVYLDKNTQKMRPGKGICLPMAQFLKLKELLPEIDNAIKSVTNK